MGARNDAWRVGDGELSAAPAGRRLGVKDNIDVAGVPTRLGSRVAGREAAPALRDAKVVAALRRAGWVVVAKTTMVELAYATHGVNPWDGTPLNACDPTRVPGGSSSGAAVGVALGALDLALGTDTGGSVRIPAAANGILGLKCSRWRGSLAGVWPLAPTLDSVGLLARDLDVLRDGLGALGVDEAPEAPRLAALARVHDAGARRVRGLFYGTLEFPVDLDELREVGSVVLDYEAARTWGDLLGERHRLDPWVRARLEAAARIPASTYLDARRRLDEASDTARRWWAQHPDVVLCTPTLELPPPQLTAWRSVRLNGLTLPWNVLGAAALSLPVGGGEGAWVTSAVPLSVQLVGPPGSEGRLIRAARRVTQLSSASPRSQASTQSRSASGSGGSRT